MTFNDVQSDRFGKIFELIELNDYTDRSFSLFDTISLKRPLK